MIYRTKSVVVEALQCTADVVVGDQRGGAGDWLVVDQHGQFMLLTDVGFRERYEPADEGEVPNRFQGERKQRKDAGKPRMKPFKEIYTALVPEPREEKDE